MHIKAVVCFLVCVSLSKGLRAQETPTAEDPGALVVLTVAPTEGPITTDPALHTTPPILPETSPISEGEEVTADPSAESSPSEPVADTTTEAPVGETSPGSDTAETAGPPVADETTTLGLQVTVAGDSSTDPPTDSGTTTPTTALTEKSTTAATSSNSSLDSKLDESNSGTDFTDKAATFGITSATNVLPAGPLLKTDLGDETTTIATTTATTKRPRTTNKKDYISLLPTTGPVMVVGASGLLPAAAVPVTDDGGFVTGLALLIAGIILFLLILLCCFYACCCMKAKPVAQKAVDLERQTPDLFPLVAGPAALRPANEMKSMPVVNSTYEYKETQKVIARHANLEPGTPNNSFAFPLAGGKYTDEVSEKYINRFSNGAEDNEPAFIENPNSKYTKPRPLNRLADDTRRINSPEAHSTPAAPDTAFKYITPRHLDSGLAQPTWERRLEVPSDGNRMSSQDVITAARVANATKSVAAAASNRQPRGENENGPDSREGTLRPLSPGLRAGILPEQRQRSASPRPFSPTHRTTLLITPTMNRDPNDPVDPVEHGMTYSQYMGMIRGEPSDFAQYSPDRRPLNQDRFSRDDNRESPV